MANNCYICFQPTNNKVCTCELKYAHKYCIIKWIIKTGNVNCSGCNKVYNGIIIRFVYYGFIQVFYDFYRIFENILELMCTFDAYGTPFGIEEAILEYQLDQGEMPPLLQAGFAAF